jgi:hypothetical protein
LEENPFERLGEEVGLLVGGGYLLKSEDIGGNLLLKVVVFDIDCMVRLVGPSLRAMSIAPLLSLPKALVVD